MPANLGAEQSACIVCASSARGTFPTVLTPLRPCTQGSRGVELRTPSVLTTHAVGQAGDIKLRDLLAICPVLDPWTQADQCALTEA